MIQVLSAVALQLRSGDVVLALGLLLLSTGAGYLALRLVRLLRSGGRGERYARFAWQLGALLGLEQAYEFTRGQIPHNTDIALMHAYRVLDLEWRHGFFVEFRVERFFLQFQTLMNAVDLFYVICHVTVTIGVLAWIYTRRRTHYPFVRNMFMLTTAIALVAFYLYPTAPPRMLANYGFVDPLQLHHFVGAGGEQPDSYTYNPYAAMPSLHVGYALVAVWGLLVAERSRLVRLLAALYPFLMAAAVVISGNHWLLDVAGAVVTVALARSFLFIMSLLASRLRAALHLEILQGRAMDGSLRSSTSAAEP